MCFPIWPDWPPLPLPPLNPPAPAPRRSERPDETPVSHPDPSVPQKRPSVGRQAAGIILTRPIEAHGKAPSRNAARVRILFVDDSATKDSWHVGYGGFCIDADVLPALTRDLQDLKKRFALPSGVEIKWSPDKAHYLRTKFTGVRHELNKAVIELLGQHDARVICAVHALKECYGVALHGWTRDRATRWAVRQQLRFIAERYERPYLTSLSQNGLIICDEHDSKTEQHMAAQQFAFDMVFGTRYEIFERIAHLPLITLSKFSAPLQIADVVIGVVTSAVGGGRYGIALFDSVARHF